MGKSVRNPNVKTYGGKELTGYLIGLAGQNMIYNIISSGLMYYFQSVIFLPAMAYSTIVAIAHRLSTIMNADLILVIDSGEIAERGTHAQLMEKKGIYYRMQMAQV